MNVDWMTRWINCGLIRSFLLFVKSLVLLSIELLANTIRDVIIGLEDSSLLHVFNEGL